MKLRKTRVALLVGGPSSEHDISLLSGRTVHQNLDRSKFDILPVLIDRKGRWSVPPKDLPGVSEAAFISLHGEYGEDGTVQEILRDLDMPYTWSDPMASALAINKPIAYRVFQAHGMNVPKIQVVGRHNVRDLDIEALELPVIVKPVNKGPLAGVSWVRRTKDLDVALNRAFAFGRTVMIKNFIPGMEFSCGVIDDGMGNVVPLPVVGDTMKAGAHLEHDWYGTGIPREIKLVRLAPKELGIAQAIAVRAHQAIGASGASKTRMILGEDGEIYVLETSTIPAMTETSFLPRAVQAHGMSLPEMLERILETAFVRHQSSKKL